jgi:RNA polymerase sigma-70 factor (ECF subfamily)
MESSKQERFMQVYEPVHERFERYCKTRVYGEFHFKDIMHDTLVVAFEKFDELKSKPIQLENFGRNKTTSII